MTYSGKPRDGERRRNTERQRSPRSSSAQGSFQKLDLPLSEGNNKMLPAFQPPEKVSIAVDPVALITTECIAVTSAMRKHARWAHSSVSAILGGSSPPSYNQEVTRSSIARGDGQKGRRNTSSGKYHLVDGNEDNLASRWGLRGKKGKSLQDNPLMSAFARLRNDLKGCTDIWDFDVPSLLHPFLQVIRSSSTSAPITSLALVAITRFFAYNLISRDSPRLSLAMQLLSAAITHCRFEASESAADEIVLLRILKLMEGMLSGPGGDLLGDESVCEMMETGLSMCCQNRLSELLRRSAEMSMVAMSQIIFERLKYLEVQDYEDMKKLDATSPNDLSVIKMEPSINGTGVSSSFHIRNGGISASDLDNSSSTQKFDDDSRASVNFEHPPPDNEMVPFSSGNDPAQAQEPYSANDMIHIKPYSLPSIRELFRVLVDLLQPHDRQHTDTMRVMALRIINVALEVAGPHLAKHENLAVLAKDDLCRHLFQLVRSENMALLSESLRVAGTLLSTCRSVLKLQQELFLSYLVACLHPRVEIPQETGIDPALYEGVPQIPKLVKPPPSQVNSGRSTPVPVKDRQQLGMEGGTRKPDSREAMVECLGALVRVPSFLVELFVNYDCEVDRSDLCEDLVGLLSRNAFPDSATWSTTNVPPLCLDALLGYLQFTADRLEDEPKLDGFPETQKLREQRARKRIIIRGATKFNENPKAGIAYLASKGIIEDSADPSSVTKFLKGTTRISKKTLGEFISKKSHEHLLGTFLDLFDFSGKRVDEALRDLLGTFRLPGESPLIERIVTVFSEKYCANSTPEGIADKDAVYVLTYAIIMLNTDQHNPNVKTQNRMSFNDFARNLRGVNGGKDFEADYLQQIYTEIKTNEIILPDEHDNKHAFDYAWKELLVKTKSAGDLVICDTNIFDSDMFSATWKPIIATLSYVFMSASDNTVFSRVITGFDQCARITATYGLTDAFDHIIFCLSSITTLATDVAPNTKLNTEVQAGDKSVMVSELAVKFGREFKAQLATVVLFRIISGNESKIKDGWKHIVRIWLNLFVNSLIKPLFGDQSILEMPPISVHSPSQVIDRGQRPNDSGIFQAFTSYLSSYAADDPPEPSDEELESTLCTVDCISACSINTIFNNVIKLSPHALKSLVQALLKQLPEDPSPAVIVVKSDMPPSSQPKANGHGNDVTAPSYDPSIVYVLELATILALRDDESVRVVGQDVAEALQSVVKDSANIHPVVISRVVYYLLRLLKATHNHSYLRAPVVLHTISSFNRVTLEKSALAVLKGLALCTRDAGPLKSEIANTPDFWLTIRSLREIQQAASIVFDLLETILLAPPSSITADNYEAAVSLLNDFATAGSVGAISEQNRDKNARKSQQGRQTKSQPDTPLNSREVTLRQSSENSVVAHGVKAISLVFQLTNRVPLLVQQSHLERNEAWTTYWSPIFRTLSTHCVNPCREIRHQAFSCLQRCLLSPELASADHKEWTGIFGEVLFPLILRLLKPEVYQSDPVGMGETRVQAATLLCKIFLHYLVMLSEWEGMLDLWLSILDIMDRLMNSGQGDNLEEAVPESLKNILLIMADGGYLERNSPNPVNAQLWEETRKRLDRFLPSLFTDVFPPQAESDPIPENSMSESHVDNNSPAPENDNLSHDALT